jgi:hypothetical protein
LTTNHIKPLLPKKIPNIYSSVYESIKSDTSRKNNTAKSANNTAKSANNTAKSTSNTAKSTNNNCSIDVRSPQDLQKPLLYLEKK